MASELGLVIGRNIARELDHADYPEQVERGTPPGPGWARGAFNGKTERCEAYLTPAWTFATFTDASACAWIAFAIR
jgi:hypothetical protein